MPLALNIGPHSTPIKITSTTVDVQLQCIRIHNNIRIRPLLHSMPFYIPLSLLYLLHFVIYPTSLYQIYINIILNIGPHSTPVKSTSTTATTAPSTFLLALSSLILCTPTLPYLPHIPTVMNIGPHFTPVKSISTTATTAPELLDSPQTLPAWTRVSCTAVV